VLLALLLLRGSGLGDRKRRLGGAGEGQPMMPAGNYLYNYNAFVKGFSARDEHGHDNGLGMSLSTEAYALRLLYVAGPGPIAAGNLAFEAGVVYTRTQLDMDSVDSSTVSGISDITFGPSPGRHFGAYHDLLALLVTAPTGDQDPHRLVNVGRSAWRDSGILGLDLVSAPGYRSQRAGKRGL
jgi:hypothetical protein